MSKINWYPGHMRSSARQLRQQFQHSDLILEVRDARAPLASASHGLGDFLSQLPILLILNKADLADPVVNHEWKNQLHRNYRHVLVMSSTPKGAKILLHYLKKHWSDGEIKGQWQRPRRMLVVGTPNVGKSSLINSIVSSIGLKRQLRVENRAGVTRQIERIPILPQLTLFDSPGVLPPNLACADTALVLALIGAIKEQILPHHHVGPALVALVERLYPHHISEHFQLPAVPGAQIFEQLARKWGFYREPQGIDDERTTRRLLLQLAQGKMGRLSLEHP